MEITHYKTFTQHWGISPVLGKFSHQKLHFLYIFWDWISKTIQNTCFLYSHIIPTYT